MVEAASFDIVTVSFGVRNIPGSDRPAVYRQVQRALKRGRGKLFVLEFVQPEGEEGALLAKVARWFVSGVVPVLGRAVAGGRFSEQYRHLSSSIGAFPPSHAFLSELALHGFLRCHKHNIFMRTVFLFACDY
jgi:ubiquinone/menaquinone biosynthesis C-methylase UbiE